MRPSNLGVETRKEAPATINSTELLTVAELAQRLRVAPSWVYGHADLLGAYRLGKYLRFTWSRVLERIEGPARINVGVAAQRPSLRSMKLRG
jgi:hypothetical protein